VLTRVPYSIRSGARDGLADWTGLVGLPFQGAFLTANLLVWAFFLDIYAQYRGAVCADSRGGMLVDGAIVSASCGPLPAEGKRASATGSTRHSRMKLAGDCLPRNRHSHRISIPLPCSWAAGGQL